MSTHSDLASSLASELTVAQGTDICPHRIDAVLDRMAMESQWSDMREKLADPTFPDRAHYLEVLAIWLDDLRPEFGHEDAPQLPAIAFAQAATSAAKITNAGVAATLIPTAPRRG